MATIASLLASFQALNTDKIIQDSLVETKGSFEESNRNQLLAGKTKTGEPIAPNYINPKYARVKNEINSAPGLGTPDLRVTGAFYAGIDTAIDNDVINAFSKDQKGPQLEGKYDNILGLGTTFKSDWLNNYLAPTVQGKITNVVGLKFG